jgi:hypothetical protein
MKKTLRSASFLLLGCLEVHSASGLIEHRQVIRNVVDRKPQQHDFRENYQPTAAAAESSYLANFRMLAALPAIRLLFGAGWCASGCWARWSCFGSRRNR